MTPGAAALLSALFAAAVPGAGPADPDPGYWPQWRGPSGQGYVADTRVPLTWGEKENLLWKTELPGRGNSSPVVWGDRVFLTAATPDGGRRLVLCVRAGDGKLLWQRVASEGVEPGKTHPWNGYASASCATDGRRVYAFFGTPGLFCYDLDGRLLWKHAFGVFTSEAGWGTAASPFLFEDLVIQNCDNDGAKALPPGRRPAEAAPAALVALDKATGAVRWSAPRDQGRGFSTPRLVGADLALNGPHGVWGYDPRTGKERWRCTRDDSQDQARFGEPMPVDDGRTLFVESGRPGPCQALRLPAAGDVTGSRVLWAVVRRGHRDVASPVLWEGRVYAADNKGMLTCLDLASGKELYNERIGNGRNKALASPVVVRGKLLFLLDDGVTVVVDPGPALRVVGRNRLGDGELLDFGASPVAADGRLFLRSQSRLYCVGEPGRGTAAGPGAQPGRGSGAE
jgi:outer membrane protein assembly factor BamB